MNKNPSTRVNTAVLNEQSVLSRRRVDDFPPRWRGERPADRRRPGCRWRADPARSPMVMERYSGDGAAALPLTVPVLGFCAAAPAWFAG